MNITIKRHFRYLYILSIFIVLHSCAKYNAGIVKQTYHDLTGHYNGYFNGNEIYQEQIKTLISSRKDDYNNVLSLYPYGYLSEIKDQNSTLTTCIDKARLSIQTHQEKRDGKNFNAKEDNSISNWADDAFLLIGKSYYMQGKLDSAISCLLYVPVNFDEGVDARSKKKIKKQKNSKKLKEKEKKLEKKEIALLKKGKDIRPKKKLLVHDVAKSEALVWLAKSYASNKQFTESEAILTFAESDNTFLKNYDKEVQMAHAFVFLEQENTKSAIPYIEKSIELTKKQKNKAHLQFVLAQLYEEQGQTADAKKLYEKSTKKNNNFEMIFYGKLKQIKMSRDDVGKSKSTGKLISQMLKDSKNKPYFDQLYYEKALMALADEKRDDAKKYLEKSIKISTVNQKQKAISYTALADMNYEEELYTQAQALYDSAFSLIDENFSDYQKIKTRSEVLTELVAQLETIKTNDSLLVLAAMPSKQLETILYDKAVEQVDNEIKNAAKKKQEDLMASAKEQSSKTNKNAWYFYSESSRNSGYKKFIQKWGNIELADNWRRSSKSDENGGGSDEENEEDDYMAKVDKVYNDMLNSIPKTEESKLALKNEIIDAYYNGAKIYKVGLDNIPKSIEMFERLNNKYPKNKYEDEALYQLYVLNKDVNQSKSDKFKNELLTQYPNSKFSGYIKNPNAKNQNDNKAVEDYYESLYAKYKTEQYDDVILACEEVDTKYVVNPLKAKFDLLKAMCIGGKKLYDPYVASLEYVVNTHKNTQEEEKAAEILAYLRGEDPSKKVSTSEGGKNANDKINPGNVKTMEKELNKTPTTNPKDVKDGLKINVGSKEINVGGKGKVKKGE